MFNKTAISIFAAIGISCIQAWGHGVDVRSLGAAGDGTNDDTPAFRAAIAEIAKQGGGTVHIPQGTYRITESLHLPTGITLRGENQRASRLLAPPGADFDLLKIDGAEDVIISDLSLMEENHGTAKPNGFGISINNGTKFLLVENVSVTGFSSGISLGRAEEKEVSQIIFRNCRTERSSRGFGFDLANCHTVLLDSCFAYEHWLDGIKFRRLTRDVTVRGGESSRNGLSRLSNPKWNGNGVDGYAGGNGFVIDGLVAEHNQGSGIYIKTGSAKVIGEGMVGNGLISNVRCRFNIGSGLDINRSGGDLPKGGDKLSVLLGDIVVSGGIFERNTRAGIYLRGRNLTLLAPIVKRNDNAGIEIASGGDITIIGALVSANSQAAAGKWPGIAINTAGDKATVRRLTIRDGVINGVDSEFLSDVDSVEGQTVWHKVAIQMSPNNNEITIEGMRMRNWTEPGPPVEGGIADEK